MKYHYNTYSMPNKKIITIVSLILVITIIGIAFSGGITGMASLEKESEKTNIDQDFLNEAALYENDDCEIIEKVYTELEQYTENECIKFPYVEPVCETGNLNYTLSKQCYWSNNLTTLNTRCSITNIDGVEGDFAIEIGIINKDGVRITEQQSVSIYPRVTENLKYSYDIDMGTCYCDVIDIPKREVCYDNITYTEKCYDLKKYKEVEKTNLIEVC
ncbi:MAG: hypothetical protein KJ906_03160 [Nanoarchaeota archaeon]|nr:hypothetical protein [Nanoarchaeota archaeon]